METNGNVTQYTMTSLVHLKQTSRKTLSRTFHGNNLIQFLANHRGAVNNYEYTYTII